MSTAISCTRAAVPRATYKASRCRRFASTEAVSTGTATPPIISTQRAKKITEPLNVKMHRLLYPEHYERRDAKNWKPKPGVARTRTHKPAPKPIDGKWAAAMRQEGVQTHLSTSTLPNLSADIPRNSNRVSKPIKPKHESNPTPQANTSASPSSPQAPLTSRKPAPTPSQP
jgi:hypothetical protein